MLPKDSIGISPTDQITPLDGLCTVSKFFIQESCFLVIPLECFADIASSHIDDEKLYSLVPSALGHLNFAGKHYIICNGQQEQPDQYHELMKLLTERELQIAALVALGWPNKQVANHLSISEWTVSSHLRRIFIKLNVDSRAAMVYLCAPMIKSLNLSPAMQ